MNDSEPVHFGASFKTVYYSHSFSNLDSWNLQHQRFLVIENHLKKTGKDHTKFLEKQSFTQGEDWRFILKVTINKFTSIQNKLFMILNFNIN